MTFVNSSSCLVLYNKTSHSSSSKIRRHFLVQSKASRLASSLAYWSQRQLVMLHSKMQNILYLTSDRLTALHSTLSAPLILVHSSSPTLGAILATWLVRLPIAKKMA